MLPRQASELPSPTSQPKQQEPKQQPVEPPQSNRTVTFALVEGLTRDLGESNRLVIPLDASLVRLDLTFQRNDYRTYRADLRKAEGNLVWRGGISVKSKQSGKPGSGLQLPASILKNGDYILTLSSVSKGGTTEVVAEYSFRVVRK